MALIIGLALITLTVISILSSVFAILNARKIFQLKEDMHDLKVRLQNTKFEKSQVEVELNETKIMLNRNFLHDPVTGLPGRNVFDDWLVQTLNQSIRHKLVFSVMLLEIDDFKMIRNVMGQEVGDLLIKEMSERFRTSMRKVDTMSRFSENQFAFLLPQIAKAETAAYVAQRLLEAAATPFTIRDQKLFVTASIGIAIYPDDGNDIKTILKNTEISLYQAKMSGGNTHQFYREELFNLNHRELTLSSSLRSSHIYEEFALYYLPEINVETKEINSMEALLRWQHPTLGLIQPQDFLRLAENSGAINPIGDWVIKNACLQFQKWKAKGVNPVAISVNVSLRQLESTNFTYRVSQILQETGLEPRFLILEISESVLLPRLELVEKTLQMLKHLNVQVAIDDFGTGFLSLQHLRRFPVGYIKIDNTLTRDIVNNPESEAIVRMIVSLAESLSIKTIAEGVETSQQKDKLKAMNVTFMQGFYFSKPMLPHEFTQETVKTIHENV